MYFIAYYCSVHGSPVTSIGSGRAELGRVGKCESRCRQKQREIPRSAAFVPAGPQPCLIGQQFRNASLADIVEHQQGLLAGPRYDALAGHFRGADEPEPAAPARRVRG